MSLAHMNTKSRSSALRGRRDAAPVAGRQDGVSLIIVLVMMLLVALMAFASMRAGNMNEVVVGTQSESQRAFARAEALLKAGERYAYMNGVGCTTAPCLLPKDAAEFATKSVAGKDTCVAGVCYPSNPAGAAFTTPGSGQMTTANGLTYADFAKGAKLGAAVDDTMAQNSGVFWVEVFQYAASRPYVAGTDTADKMKLDQSYVGLQMPIPATSSPMIYRITAMGQGMRDTTNVVLRSYYVPREKAR